MTEKTFGTRKVTIYPAKGDRVPVVYSSDYEESGQGVLRCCRELGAPDFHLVTVSNLSWDEDLSPWPHEPVVDRNDHFTGGADAYLQFLLEEVMPFAERALEEQVSARILAGYSMAGLFSAYAPFCTDAFDAFVSASGSVWYPGFRDYFVQHDFRKKPKAMYFSLGDKETRTRNPYLRTTDAVFLELLEECRRRGISAIYEKNPGNHFVDGDLRIAKGIRWVLEELAAASE